MTPIIPKDDDRQEAIDEELQTIIKEADSKVKSTCIDDDIAINTAPVPGHEARSFVVTLNSGIGPRYQVSFIMLSKLFKLHVVL